MQKFLNGVINEANVKYELGVTEVTNFRKPGIFSVSLLKASVAKNLRYINLLHYK